MNLVKRSKQNDDQVLSIHRLVQSLRKEKIEETQRLDTIQTVAQLVAPWWIFQALRDHHSFARIVHCSTMVSHVIRIHEAWRSTGNSGLATVDDSENRVCIAVLFNDAGLYMM
jgi:hypothetical protein